jgi:mono/diheme cytochrome c family protein
MPIMRYERVLTTVAGTALAAAVSYSTTILGAQGATRSVNDGVYSSEQSSRGTTVYTDNCATCHDPNLIGGVGPALAGTEFITTWKEMTVGDLFDRIKNTMPLTSPGTLTAEQTADVVSFILSSNKFPAGMTPLATDAAALKSVKMAEPGGAASPTAGAPTAAAPAGAAPAASSGAAGGAALYADAQAKRGETVYTENCAACHDPKLIGGVGPALAGTEFIANWKDKPVTELFDRVKTTMPLTAPGTLTGQQTADVIAFILSANQFPAGATELASDPAALKADPLGEPKQK